MATSAHWKIDESTLHAEILWQRMEITSSSEASVLSPLYGIVASNSDVLYGQTHSSAICGTNFITAYDSASGEESWRFDTDGILPKLFLSSDGYILVNAFSITKIDFQGKLVWRYAAHQTQLPLRSFSSMYESDNDLYFPAESNLYKVSPQTGEILNTIPIANVLGVFDHFVLVGNEENQIQLQSLDDLQHSLYSLSFLDSKFADLPLNPSFPYVARAGNTLLLYFDSINPDAMNIEAYEFNTGKLLWKLETPFYGLPVILIDKNAFVLYTPDSGLEIRAISSGSLLGQILLERDILNENFNAYISDRVLRHSIALTGYKDTLFIRWSTTQELIAIHIDLSDFP